ncbi:G-type lectin S-receptor-like serine/threonine-protein kinase CES101 isoform X2 [Olea europaea var. sylvestris]|uniref:G-type lectin S-receptor-like serine/threonine-protein kinase CES101 isoform X2 n=1 Tax=Olea europaea var. sylvestris TaxID=158386 RepID=UPI000C1CD663|nr:G-type lectin S-receptor-like serine/threonine-protein kinase CES101 isoform X2 [Olea europaea var. sylvestris]
MMGSGLESFGDCSLPGKPHIGCVEKTLPECRKANFGFNNKIGSIGGDSYRFGNNYNMSLTECEDKCMHNYSFVAYASITKNGTGCEIWTKIMSFYTSGPVTDREIYLLMGKESNWWKWFITALGGTILMTFSIICYCVYRNSEQKILAEEN